MAAYQAAFGDLAMCVDGNERQAVGWEPWAITTDLDTSAYSSQIWQAVACHRSQLPATKALAVLSEEHGQNLWHTETYYRSFSLVNGGRKLEDDLFAGLR